MIDELSITERCFNFSVRIVHLCQFLCKRSNICNVIARQLLRSGTSIGANVEEAQAGHSKADFIAKMSIARKEARETHYWIRLIKETKLIEEVKIDDILSEAEQLVKIITAIVKSAQKGKMNEQ